jgi:hypothetical protein
MSPVDLDMYRSLLNISDDELKIKMVEYAAKEAPVTAKICLDLLLLRRHENLVNQTKELVDQTKELVKKTWLVAIATWVLAVSTIFVTFFAK